MAPRRYTSADEDSARWAQVPLRSGDIVVSTRSKHGTTWMQMVCALLVFATPDLPDRLPVISPWVDHLVTPVGELAARLAAQDHRRILKTHTPLDGLPLDPAVTYVVVGRHPLDAAVSLHHQMANIDRARLAELTGIPQTERAPVPLHDWLVRWSLRETDPYTDTDSLAGVLHHLGDAWARRAEPNVVLVHYADLEADLEGTMRAVAARLDLTPPADTWPALVDAARFSSMRDRVGELAPSTGGILRDPAAFFRRGRSGAGAEVLAAGELAAYEERVGATAPADLVAWLHR